MFESRACVFGELTVLAIGALTGRLAFGQILRLANTVVVTVLAVTAIFVKLAGDNAVTIVATHADVTKRICGAIFAAALSFAGQGRTGTRAAVGMLGTNITVQAATRAGAICGCGALSLCC